MHINSKGASLVNKPFIKICGITNYDDAKKCVDLKVNFLGFIFAESPRRITIDKANEIISKLPKIIKKVAVFKNNPIDYVIDIINKVEIDLVQLHGNEGIGYINLIERPIIKALDITDEEVSEKVKKYLGCVPLLDLPKGSDKEFKVDIAAEISKKQSIMVAGKITLDNVKEIISQVKPMAIDICSGVEKEIGIKDHKLLEKLINKIWS